MKKILLGIFCCLLVALAAPVLWTTATGETTEVVSSDDPVGAAAEAVPLSSQELTEQSELIATGECVEVKSHWIDERNLVTLATIAVNDVLKGEGQSTVTVVLPGGIDANRKFPIAMTYPGAPSISPEEKVFLFLSREESVSNGYTVVGYAQGKFSIVEDSEGRQMISRNNTKLKLQGGPGAVRSSVQLTPLSEFKERVKGYVQQQQ